MHYNKYQGMLLLLFIIFSCASIDQNSSHAELLAYKVSNTAPEELLQNIPIQISTEAIFNNDIIPSYLIEYFNEAIKTDLSHKGGIVSTDTSNPFFSVKINFSKYKIEPAYNSQHKAGIDGKILIFDLIANEVIDQQAFSLTGFEQTQGIANIKAIHKLLTYIYNNDNLLNHLKTLSRPVVEQQNLNIGKISAALRIAIEDTTTLPNGEINLAVVDLNGNEQNRVFAELLLSSLISIMPNDKYHFYSRNELNSILKEQEMQLSGIVQEADLTTIGKIRGVDYLITCNVSKGDKVNILEIKVISTENAKILVAISETFL